MCRPMPSRRASNTQNQNWSSLLDSTACYPAHCRDEGALVLYMIFARPPNMVPSTGTFHQVVKTVCSIQRGTPAYWKYADTSGG
jgi:hypothetical protein